MGIESPQDQYPKQSQMPFAPGQSGNPAGRPRGQRNRHGIGLLERHSVKLLRNLIRQAEAGDLRALEICADRLWPKLKSSYKTLEVPLGEDVATQAREILSGVFTGVIPADQAELMISTLLAYSHAVEMTELERRISALEGGPTSGCYGAPLGRVRLNAT